MLSEYLSALSDFFFSVEDTEKALDIIELSFRFIDQYTRDNNYRHYSQPSITADDAVKVLNQRFLEHGVGYKYEAGMLIRIDSGLIHAEVVRPILDLLRAEEYKGANEEFLKAHEHYRHQRYQECMNECLKAFESIMKAICHKRKWQYNQQKDTAKVLIDTCFKNNLIPKFLENHFTALRSCLESGVPTVRNKMSGHGQGVQLSTVPDYMAGYLLHLTATSILLMVEAEKQLP
jgi:tetratricopeptide (TPR) repeat protein